MTLTRRIALFIAAVLALALGGALVLHTITARQALQQQQDMRNRDAAAALALALSQQRGDAAAMQAVAAAQFDLGHYRSIVLRGTDGRATLSLHQAEGTSRAPAWFAGLLPMQVAPGTALVSSGWTELGQLQVVAQTTWAQDALWDAATRTAGLMAVLGAAAAALATWVLRAWQRPLEATVAQARALEQGRFVLAELPNLPELRQLTRAMNTTVGRLRELFAQQAEQVAYLQRRAQLDAVTGLPQRQHFIQGLQRRLDAQPGLGLPLLLVRVPQLEQINQAKGRAVADAVLRQAAAVLARQQQAEPDSLAGRVDGAAFALCLPVPGMAAELAPSLYRKLVEAVALVAPDVPVHVAAVEGLLADRAEALLAHAALVLDRADGGTALQVDAPAPLTQAMASQAAWQAQLRQALAQQRARLAEYPVRDAQGRLIHLECPLRLQLDPDGDFQPAARWLPMARRGGLVPQVDLTAIRLALAACAADGQPRAVNLALSSLSTPGLIGNVAQQLTQAPTAAKLLSIEWVDGGTLGDWQAAEHAIAAWRAHGVRMGVEHAGAAPEQLTRLRELGLDYVKVDGLHLRGAAQDADVNAYARSLVGLIQLLGLKALAEGVDRPDDLSALWQLGFDGATGHALQTPAAASGLVPAAPTPTQPRQERSAA